MSNTTILVIVIGAVAIIAIALLRRSIAGGKLKILGTEARLTTHGIGASAIGAKSARDMNVNNVGPGAATADQAQAGRDLNVSNEGPR